MAADDVQVLVVGAGPTGLSLALQAHAHGAGVRIVERRTELFRPSRALVVHPRTLEQLRPLSVSNLLVERGRTSLGARLHLGDREVHLGLDELDLPDTAFPHLLMVRQAQVEEVLAGELERRGVHVERGIDVHEVRITADGAVATLRHTSGRREVVGCRYVVGCDGPDSVVRRAMGAAWGGGPYRHEVVLADLDLHLDADLDFDANLDGLPDAHVVAGAGGLVFLFRIGELAPWRLLATRRAGTRSTPYGQPGPPLPLAELQEVLRGAGIDATIDDAPWSAVVPLQHRIASTYRRGAAFLAGDAAHTHSPAGAQGMNTGVQDALNLGWKLAYATRKEAADPALLDSYETERRPLDRRVLAMTHLIFWAEAGTDPAARWLRTGLAPALAPLAPSLLRRRRLTAEVVRTLSQLRARYRSSPLSVDAGRVRGFPRAGSRLGDASVRTGRRWTRVHDLTARPGLHLLLQRDTPDPWVAAVQDRAERGDLWVHRLVDRPGVGMCLVRPDGHVAVCDATGSPGGVHAWLDRVAP